MIGETRAALIRALLGTVDDVTREGLIETPARVAKAWGHWFGGYDVDVPALLKQFEDGAQTYDEMVFLGNIPVWSHCEHHVAPFFGVAHVGYVPYLRGHVRQRGVPAQYPSCSSAQPSLILLHASRCCRSDLYRALCVR